MTEKPVGLCAVIDDEKLQGIIVEGDIRRTLMDNSKSLETSAKDVMVQNPTTINEDDLAFEALKSMQNREKPISVLPVVKDQKFLGVVRLHDLLKAGFQAS